MPRPLPCTVPPDLGALPRAEPFLSLEIAVVTPLFGGGAEPGVVDPELPIRGSTIRGHLRFWWRACKARQWNSAGDLFKAESEIWGAAGGGQGGGPSAIDIATTILDRGHEVPCRVPHRGGDGLDWNRAFPPYVLFPFQEQRGQRGSPPKPAAMGREGVRFRLSISAAAHVAAERADALQREVEAAVWAWVSFGGVGARTRRGCGSLFADHPLCRPEGPSAAQSWLRESVARHVHRLRDPASLPIPMLLEGLALKPVPTDPLAAWREAVEALSDFRQRPGPNDEDARRPGQGHNRPGRSRWPEPDSIRQARGVAGGPHRPEHPALPYYPRADLGLPIIFQFRDDPSLNTTVEGTGDRATRMASPIIVKPWCLSATQALPMALLLAAPHVWNFSDDVLRVAGPRGDLDLKELFDPASSALVGPLRGKATAREAFMAYVAQRWTPTGGQR